MQISRFLIISSWLLLAYSSALQAQELEKLPFLQPADTFHQTRFWTAFGLGAGAYTATMIGLNQVWYADFPRSRFQFFNDWGEWESMDKLGHSYTTYFESNYVFQLLNWTGLKRQKAVWIAVGTATVFQTSLEILDGFSSNWGFSVPDIAFNTMGAGLFLAQELAWQEQRILFKVSSAGASYPDTPVPSVEGGAVSSLSQRAEDLYGGNFATRFIKDYNAQTIWLSTNVAAFLPPDNAFPDWLNIAVGYGANNMYGGFDNTWREGDQTFVLDPLDFPRYQQFYLSLDIDFTKIPTRNRFLRFLLHGLNVFKLPAPALEWNTLGQSKFHPLHF